MAFFRQATGYVASRRSPANDYHIMHSFSTGRKKTSTNPRIALITSSFSAKESRDSMS
jgi:hypothetical protein